MANIVNTSKKEIHPEYLFGGNPNAIEQQEARGQEQLVSSEQLPVECSDIDKEKLEQAGVVFGEPLEDDSLFCDAKLPEGWKKEATDHSMWSKLVDEKGKERAMIFYKAAFYGRSAHMSVS